ncbi:energy-coupling factor ABC transporter ATP-binding protein [Vallitalea longa]|uniref:Energy-coupling factor ABC transporter ATP-binding protein n=1 Tax=Vallitalea longa TaxID=2936439 RepID=A0A9W6DHM3_9FIRM|nr:ABC transporter ATP-binding protein [Vallitalea longa]GKX31009.1 energy-coupling factor ABC transporter ATP-binding protein [Vallitalea longa]
MRPAVEVKNLYFKYEGQDNNILKGIDFTINKGEIVGIVGLSGGGKSTLCYTLKGIIPNMVNGTIAGEINIFGQNINTMENYEKVKQIGMVFQDPEFQLFSSRVEDELAFALENMCVPRKTIISKVDEMLDLLGLENYRKQNPCLLSGGEKQLVALGAVLVLEPEIIIFDEAMSQVDNSGKETLKKVICNLRNNGKTIIMVDHEMNNLDIVDRILLLKQGKINIYEGDM